MNLSTSHNGSVSLHVAMILLCLVFGGLALAYSIPLALGMLTLLGMLALICVWPELGTLLVLFAIYVNFPAVAVQFHDVPAPVAGMMIGLLAIPMAQYLLIEGRELVIDVPFLLLIAFFVSLLTSSLFAKDMGIALGWIVTFLHEGLLLYFLIINAVRKLITLRRAIWALILAGSLLGSLSLYQELMHSYDNQFAGFAQRSARFGPDDPTYKGDPNFRNRHKIRPAHRAQGPIGDPNHYAKIMLVLFPLALFRFWGERSRAWRACAMLAVALIVSGVLLSYSRGAFLNLVLLLCVMTFMRYIRPVQVVTALVAIVLLMAIVAPGYINRIDTIRGAKGLVSEEAEVDPDGSTRGRITEMLAALFVFLDHPIIGVGPGQYYHFYSQKYHLNPLIAFRHLPKPRHAHILYFELAAETGLIGLTLFMAIVGVVMSQLWQVRRRCLYDRPDLAMMATGFLLGIMAFLGASVFLHLSYQRYYWIVLALAGAALQVFRAEMALEDERQEPRESPHTHPHYAVP